MDAARRRERLAGDAGGGVMAHLLRAGESPVLGPPDGVSDRFLVDSKDWGGRLGVVEHLLAPRSIAAPVHLHTREDEFSLVLEGTVGFWAAGDELVAEVGDLVFKPRNEWHTFFNPTDRPARILELISPGGLEEAFRMIDTATTEIDLEELVAPYGCSADLDATAPIIERHGLTFG